MAYTWSETLIVACSFTSGGGEDAGCVCAATLHVMITGAHAASHAFALIEASWL
jgi:hypothetical protein